MVMSDFAVDKALLRVELKSVSTTSGAQFVMTFGQTMMAMLFADSLDSLQLVHTRTHITHICCTFYEVTSFAGAVVHFSAFFGSGIGPIWLDNVHCSGTESRLVNCSSSRVGTHNCYHTEDAGVTCQSKLAT